MSQDQFHWMVVRNSDDLIKQSRELFKAGGAVKGGASPNKTNWYIPGPDDPTGEGLASTHHVPSVSSGTMHFEVSTVAFESGELATKWATTKEGVQFLSNRQDAILVALRKRG